MIRITLTRGLVGGDGTPRTAGTTYDELDDLAELYVANGWAMKGAVYGARVCATLAAPARSSGNPTLKLWTEVSGVQALSFYALGLAAGDVIVAAWSGNSNDATALGSLISTIAGDLEAGTPAGVWAAQTLVVPAAGKWEAVLWDQSIRIASFAAVVCKLGAATGGTAQRLLLDLTY